MRLFRCLSMVVEMAWLTLCLCTLVWATNRLKKLKVPAHWIVSV